MKTDKGDQFKSVGGRWRFVAVVFIIISLLLSVIVVVLGVLIHRKSTTSNTPDSSGDNFCGDISSENIDVTEADNPGVFDDLTSKELSAIQKYIYSKQELNLVSPSEASLDKSYVYTMDLYLPNKEYVLEYLNGNRSKPDREALVVIFRGDKSPPVVEEYIVGPLPNPSNIRHAPNRPNPIPFNIRPIGSPEYAKITPFLVEIGSKLKHILAESYDATFDYAECGQKCLSYYPVPVGSGILGATERKVWIIVSHYSEYYNLHPLGLAVLLALNSSNPPDDYFVDTILYNRQKFGSVDEFVSKYNAGEVTKQRVPFPKNSFSTLNLRGRPVPTEPKRPPKYFEPDGKRYSITHRHVEYMQWKFNFRMSVFSGPQIYNLEFNDERLAYEVSLQEIAVYYSGNNAVHQAADFIDSADLLGINSFGLFPGADCPETSTFINGFYLKDFTKEPEKLTNMFCIFEENSGFPLRRHAGYHGYHGQFYSGMMDSSLVLRSAITIGNYDYIIDYVFHQNGVFQIRTAATGFIFASFYTPEEHGYGFRLHDNILGNIHHHMFNFKLDIDIHGTSNRYETLDISATEVRNDYSLSNNTYWQTKFDQQLKRTEREAAYKFDFKSPKYHLIHNNDVKTRHGEIAGYRLHLEGISHQPLPEDEGNEPTVSWARYQLAVTKSKDTERRSSSCYGSYDSLNPVVNFTNFLADDENIVDEDLVVWASIGHHHIPHTEDLPLTTTTGGHLGIFLLPYNYFDECPSMASRDAIRLDPIDKENGAAGVKTERYGNSNENMCIPRTVSLEKTANALGELFDG